MRLPVLERGEAPLVRQRDGQRHQHHDAALDGRKDPLGHLRSHVQHAGDSHSIADGRPAVEVHDEEFQNDARENENQIPDGEGAKPPLQEKSVDEEQAVRKVNARIHQEEEGIQQVDPERQKQLSDQVRKHGRYKEQRQQDAQEEDGSFACHRWWCDTQR